MDIKEIPDDEFVAEAIRRASHYSPNRYATPLQSDDTAKLDILRSRVISLNKKCNIEGRDNPELREAAALCDTLDGISYNPLDRSRIPPATNTTYYGRDLYEDHSPQAYEGNDENSSS